MTDESNVVAFEPSRLRQAPALRSIELRLLGDHCDIQATLFDENGDVVAVLAYSLAAKPNDFDLGRLVAAWDQWRGGTAAAS